MTTNRETGLTFAFAILALLSLINQSLDERPGYGAPVTAYWAFMTYLAYKGKLPEIRTWLRYMFFFSSAALVLAVMFLDDSTAYILGYESTQEVLFTGFLSVVGLLVISAFVSTKLGLTVPEFFFDSKTQTRTKDERGAVVAAPDQLLTKNRLQSPPLSRDTEGSRITPGSASQSLKLTQADYAKALDEFESQNRDKNLYAQLLVECDGDEGKIRARYVAARAMQLAEIASSDITCLNTTAFNTDFVISGNAGTRIFILKNGHVAVRSGSKFLVYQSRQDASDAIVHGDFDRQSVITVIDRSQLRGDLTIFDKN